MCLFSADERRRSSGRTERRLFAQAREDLRLLFVTDVPLASVLDGQNSRLQTDCAAWQRSLGRTRGARPCLRQKRAAQ